MCSLIILRECYEIWFNNLGICDFFLNRFRDGREKEMVMMVRGSGETETVGMKS